MSLSARDAADRVAQLIALTDRLSARLLAEAQLFEARRPHDAAPGTPQTMELANLYRLEAARVRQDPTLIAGASDAQRLILMRATTAFEAVVARHGRSVNAARIVTEGIVRAVAQEVAARRAPAAAYGAGGRARTGDSSAITLNRRA